MDALSEYYTYHHYRVGDDFVVWVPNLAKSSFCEIPPDGITAGASLIANHTAIKGIFQRINAQYSKMFKRKAFLHSYKGEGMDELEFVEAEHSLKELITEYQKKQDADVDLEGDEDDEDLDEDEDEDGDEESSEEEDF